MYTHDYAQALNLFCPLRASGRHVDSRVMPNTQSFLNTVPREKIARLKKRLIRSLGQENPRPMQNTFVC